jgi:hypothetical protein
LLAKLIRKTWAGVICWIGGSDGFGEKSVLLMSREDRMWCSSAEGLARMDEEMLAELKYRVLVKFWY